MDITRLFVIALAIAVPVSLALSFGRVAEQLTQYERCEALYEQIETDTDTYVYDMLCSDSVSPSEAGY